MKHGSISISISISVSVIVLAIPGLAGLPFCAEAQKQNPAQTAFDPQAVRLLQEMAETYTHLTSLRQETEFLSIVEPLVRLPTAPSPNGDAPGTSRSKDPFNKERKLDRKLRLWFEAPNRLRLETEEGDETGKIKISSWVSDGKSFWTFNPDKNLFSREKSPAKISDFAKLAHMTSGSLEMLMLMGVNPFAHVEEQTEGVHYAGKETVRGTETDVVTMRADLGPQLAETRLYIRASDHLLFRLVSETTQKARPPKRIGGGSPLDELERGDPNPEPPPLGPDDVPALVGVLMKSQVICDNLLDTQPTFDALSFAYNPPAGALYLTNPLERKAPLTMKQRIAEWGRVAVKKNKKSPPKVIRF